MKMLNRLMMTSLIPLMGLACGPELTAEEEALANSESGLSAEASINQSLAQARAATAKYHDVDVAIADGFFQAGPCTQLPDGSMGIHFVNPPRIDGTIEVEDPQLLLYFPQEDGSLKLVGIEYFQPVFVNGVPWFGPIPPPPGAINPAPVIFGRPMDGPMPGHDPSMPWHYDLHVWLWENNPSGTFHHTNPSLTCPGAAHPDDGHEH